MEANGAAHDQWVWCVQEDGSLLCISLELQTTSSTSRVERALWRDMNSHITQKKGRDTREPDEDEEEADSKEEMEVMVGDGVAGTQGVCPQPEPSGPDFQTTKEEDGIQDG